MSAATNPKIVKMQTDRTSSSKSKTERENKKKPIRYTKDFLVKCFKHPACRLKPVDLNCSIECTLSNPRIIGDNPLPETVHHHRPPPRNRRGYNMMGDLDLDDWDRRRRPVRQQILERETRHNGRFEGNGGGEYRSKNEEEEPLWFNEPMSRDDTIELTGGPPELKGPVGYNDKGLMGQNDKAPIGHTDKRPMIHNDKRPMGTNDEDPMGHANNEQFHPCPGKSRFAGLFQKSSEEESKNVEDPTGTKNLTDFLSDNLRKMILTGDSPNNTNVQNEEKKIESNPKKVEDRAAFENILHQIVQKGQDSMSNAESPKSEGPTIAAAVQGPNLNLPRTNGGPSSQIPTLNPLNLFNEQLRSQEATQQYPLFTPGQLMSLLPPEVQFAVSNVVICPDLIAQPDLMKFLNAIKSGELPLNELLHRVNSHAFPNQQLIHVALKLVLQGKLPIRGLVFPSHVHTNQTRAYGMPPFAGMYPPAVIPPHFTGLYGHAVPPYIGANGHGMPPPPFGIYGRGGMPPH